MVTLLLQYSPTEKYAFAEQHSECEEVDQNNLESYQRDSQQKSPSRLKIHERDPICPG